MKSKQQERSIQTPVNVVASIQTPLERAEGAVNRLQEERQTAEADIAAARRQVEALGTKRTEVLQSLAEGESAFNANASGTLASLRDEADIETARIGLLQKRLAAIDREFLSAVEVFRLELLEFKRVLMDEAFEAYREAVEAFLPVARNFAALGHAFSEPMEAVESIEFSDPFQRKFLGRVRELEMSNGTWMPSLPVSPEFKSVVEAASALKQRFEIALSRARHIKENLPPEAIVPNTTIRAGERQIPAVRMGGIQ